VALFIYTHCVYVQKLQDHANWMNVFDTKHTLHYESIANVEENQNHSVQIKDE